MFLASFAAVMGPMTYLYHLLSTPRLPFTAAYFGSIILTLVFALKVSASPDGKTRLLLTLDLASQHSLDPFLGPYPARLSALVSDQLFPYGINWSAPSYIVWNQTSHCLDDGLEYLSCRHGSGCPNLLSVCEWASRFESPPELLGTCF